MGIFDDASTSDIAPSLMGGASGGATGFAIGGPPGAAIGAGIGALGGFLGSSGARKAKEAQQKALEQAMQRLQVLSQQQYQGRMSDLNKAMSFYGPVNDQLARMYGSYQHLAGNGTLQRATGPAPVDQGPSLTRGPGAF